MDHKNIPDGIRDHPQSDINSFNKLFIKSLIIIVYTLPLYAIEQIYILFFLYPFHFIIQIFLLLFFTRSNY